MANPFILPISSGSGGGGGPGTAPASVSTGIVWVVNSSQTSGSYANGLRYVPLSSGASDWFEFQVQAARTGTFSIEIVAAMSAADTDVINLRIDTAVIDVGDDPNTTMTMGTPFDVTVPNSTDTFVVTSADDASLSFSVVENRINIVRVTRLDSAHAGELRIIELRG